MSEHHELMQDGQNDSKREEMSVTDQRQVITGMTPRKIFTLSDLPKSG